MKRHLEQKAEDTVSRHGGDEVPPGRLELGGHLVSVLLDEVGVQVGVGLPAQLVPGLGLGHALDHPATGLGGHYLEGRGG